jgi:hypothetical protein
MTVIRLDAATLAKVKAGGEPVFLGDESGTPVLRISVVPVPPDREPTEEELAESEAGEGYTLAEVLAHLRTLEKK